MLSAEMIRSGLLIAKDFERCSYQELIVNADQEAKNNQRGK
jgi:endonuclease YncB( thermonuclease family)